MPTLTDVGNGLLGSPGSTGTAPVSVFSDPLGALGNAATGLGASVGSAATNAVTSVLFSSRVIAIVLGLILIAGSILLYIGEDLSGAIESGGKLAAKVAS